MGSRPAAKREPTSAERRPVRVSDLLIVPALYFLGAKAGIASTAMAEGIAIVWPPNAVLLASWLRLGGPGLWLLALCVLGAEVLADVPTFSTAEALLFGVNNIVEAAVASALLRRFGFDSRFQSAADVGKFALAGPGVAALLAACGGAATYTLFQRTDTGYLQFLRIWWFGDALGLMVFTPLLLMLWQRTTPAWLPPPLSAKDGVVGFLGFATVVALTVSREGMLFGMHAGPILLLPFVLYVAARWSWAATTLVVACAAALVVVLTARGRNPFGHQTAAEMVVHAQEFIVVMSLLAFGLNAVLSEVRANREDLRLANQELRSRSEALERSNDELSHAKAEVLDLNESLERRVQERTRELQQALAQVKQLRGLLPVCSWCKRIRDDKDYWLSVEQYIAERTDATFTHGICPDCMRKHFPEIDKTTS